jgi:hypothetical protein
MARISGSSSSPSSSGDSATPAADAAAAGNDGDVFLLEAPIESQAAPGAPSASPSSLTDLYDEDGEVRESNGAKPETGGVSTPPPISANFFGSCLSTDTNPTQPTACRPHPRPQLPPTWVRYSIAGINIMTVCVAM